MLVNSPVTNRNVTQPGKREQARIDIQMIYFGLIFVIFDPCRPRPAISPFWEKMKA